MTRIDRDIYNVCVVSPIPGNWEGGEQVDIIVSFMVAVMAGVACHLICKWLDSNNKDN